MSNPLVAQWVADQTVAIIELLTAIICFTIIVRRLYHGGDFHHNPPKSYKIALYCVYIFTIIHAASALSIVSMLPIAKAIFPASSNHQLAICWGTMVGVLPSFVALQTAIIYLFIMRLDIAFRGTPLALSKCLNYTFRVVYPLFMGSICLYIAFIIKPYPYDIYNHRVDLNGNGVTCSVWLGVEPNPALAACAGFIGIGLIAGNVTVWVLFMKRLYKLMKMELESEDLRTKNTIHDAQFLILMKEQTFIVFIAVFSTLCSWGFQSLVAWGQITAHLDIAVSIFAVFFSFKFNRRYFEKLKCDRCTNICCGVCFEQCIERRFHPKAVEVEQSSAKTSDTCTTTSGTIDFTTIDVTSGTGTGTATTASST